jgi:hypothetical protein
MTITETIVEHREEEREKEKEKDEDGDGRGGRHLEQSRRDPKNKTIRLLTQRIVESVIDELNQEEMKTRVQDHIVAPLIHLMNQEDTKRRVNDHVISPLIKLMYSQMFPYLIVAAIILLSGLVMWVLMFTMFAMTYFRK